MEIKGQGGGGAGGGGKFGGLEEVCVRVVAGFRKQGRPGAPSPVPGLKGCPYKTGSICLPIPLERNSQEAGGDHINPRAPARPRLERESDRGNQDGQAGQRSTFKN